MRSPHTLGNGRTLSLRRTVLYLKQQRILETTTAKKTVVGNMLKDFTGRIKTSVQFQTAAALTAGSALGPLTSPDSLCHWGISRAWSENTPIRSQRSCFHLDVSPSPVGRRQCLAPLPSPQHLTNLKIPFLH